MKKGITAIILTAAMIFMLLPFTAISAAGDYAPAEPAAGNVYLEMTIDTHRTAAGDPIFYHSYIHHGNGYVIKPGDFLVYDVYFETDSPGPGWGGIDVLMRPSEGAETWSHHLSDYGLTDIYGVAVQNGDLTRWAHEKWYRRTIDISDFAGQQMDWSIMVFMPENDASGVVRYGAVCIVNNGEVVHNIYSASGGMWQTFPAFWGAEWHGDKTTGNPKTKTNLTAEPVTDSQVDINDGEATIVIKQYTLTGTNDAVYSPDTDPQGQAGLVPFVPAMPIGDSGAAAPEGILFELGDFTEIEQDGKLNGWEQPINDSLRAAERFEAEFEDWVNSVSFILCGDGNNWGWPENFIEVDGTKMTVILADAEGWDEILTGSRVKIMLTMSYSIPWEDIGLKNAAFVSGDATIFEPEPEKPPVDTVPPDEDPGDNDDDKPDPTTTAGPDSQTTENPDDKKEGGGDAFDSTIVIIIIVIVLVAVGVVLLVVIKGKKK
jgi:hypothetical protein